MKDILRIIKFDYYVAAPTALPATLLSIFVVSIVSLLAFPGASSYLAFVAMAFVIPLQGAAEKKGFARIYGVLPVKRENITRARFAYIFLAHFSMEIIGIIMAVISILLKLNRFLPDKASVLVEVAEENYSFHTFMNFGMCVGAFAVFCIIFSYMEMAGQIFGRENEMKILLISLAVSIAVIFGYGALSTHGFLPMINFDKMTDMSIKKCIIISVGSNILTAVLCVIFGLITTKAVSKREI